MALYQFCQNRKRMNLPPGTPRRRKHGAAKRPPPAARGGGLVQTVQLRGNRRDKKGKKAGCLTSRSNPVTNKSGDKLAGIIPIYKKPPVSVAGAALCKRRNVKSSAVARRTAEASHPVF